MNRNNKKKQQDLQKTEPQSKPSKVDDKSQFDFNDILGRLNKEGSGEIEKVELSALLHTRESYSGAFPHPKLIKDWESVLPGCADRIFTQVENQSLHRQGLETKVITSNIKSSERGQIFAFIIAMTVVIGSIVLIAMGKEVYGLVSLIIALASLVGIFIYGKTEGQKELAEKKDQLKQIQKESEKESEN